MYLKLEGGGPLLPGTYHLATNEPYSKVIRALEQGPPLVVDKLVVPEGFTVAKIAVAVGRLSSVGISARDFMEAATGGQVRSPYEPAGTNNLEGFLFPATYPVHKGETGDELVQYMVDTFGYYASQLGLAAAAEKLGYSPYQVVTVASIVEREAKLESDRGPIASVIYNRLARGIPIGADSTLLYGLGNPAGPVDFNVPNPYNTRLHRGLPPTPISSPGVPSLEAAMAPAQDLFSLLGRDEPQRQDELRFERAAVRAPAGRVQEGRPVLTSPREPRLRRSGRLGTWPDGSTVVAGVIGDPVTHSLSPALHNAALKELGLDWVYVAFPVPTGHVRAAVGAMADLGIRGLSVTMPHKAGAAAACHRLNAVAERLGVVNTVTNVGGQLVGDSTDGGGFVDSLCDQGWYPEGKRCLVLGAGGAARAVVLALAEAGAARVDVVARRPEQALEVAAFAGTVGKAGWVEAAAEADLVVNATPVGMGGVGKSTGPAGGGAGGAVGEGVADWPRACWRRRRGCAAFRPRPELPWGGAAGGRPDLRARRRRPCCWWHVPRGRTRATVSGC